MLRLGRVAEGMRLLDEAMLAVATEELQPEWAGDLYCHTMAACHELGDYRRARHWTAATERWLATLPAAALFTGICRVHRAQLHQIGGDWERAEREAVQVCIDLAAIHCASAAEGHYLVGEIRRLRGDDAAAETAYRAAHQLGRDPQPGLALLRLAQGRAATADAAIRAALTAETGNPLRRALLCAAQVEITLAVDDPVTARKASDELARPRRPSAARPSVPPRSRRRARYSSPRARCRRPYRCCGRRAAPGASWMRPTRPRASGYSSPQPTAASATSRPLSGSSTTRLRCSPRSAPPGTCARSTSFPVAAPNGLTREREVEVLRCLAAGGTNREIAHALIISEKTVARHLANIFTKLGVTSRTAAAAVAFEHGLVLPAEGEPRNHHEAYAGAGVSRCA